MNNRLAIALMAFAMIALSTNDALFKHLGSQLPMGQAIAIRGAILCSLLATLLIVTGHGVKSRWLTDRWCLLRGLFEICATFLFLFSLAHVPLAVATTLVFTSPLLLTALSGPVLGERVGPWRWLAVVAGFVGVLLITWPGDDVFNRWLLMPLGAAVCMAGRDISTRFVPEQVPNASVTLTTSLMVLAASLFTASFGWSSDVTPGHVGLAALAALLIGASFVCSIKALRIGELSLLAPVQYVVIIWATFLGAVIWNEIPTVHALTGGAMIICSGLVIIWRERVSSLATTR